MIETSTSTIGDLVNHVNDSIARVHASAYPDITHTVQYRDAFGDAVVAEFTDADSAWQFVRLCDVHGVPAGYPHWVFS